MINNDIFKKISSKILIISTYIVIIAFFLYLSEILNLFLPQKEIINIYTPTDMIPPEVAETFEKKTGIKVHLKYFDTNEELLAKFKIDKGIGYDLIIVSNHVINFLHKEQLLKKINLNQVSNFSLIDPRLLALNFDPENEYTIPFVWSTYGIIFKKDIIKNRSLGINWDLIFKNPNLILNAENKNDSLTYKICMINEPLEVIFLAAIYLFNKTQNLTDDELFAIKELLIQQKKWVEIYMFGSLQYYLFGDVVPLAVTSSAFAKKIMEISDDFDYVVPKKGTIFAIDSFAIPNVSNKENLVYKFINFLLEKENVLKNNRRYGYNPANKQAYAEIPQKFLNNQSFFPDNEMFKKLHLITDEIDTYKVEKLWFEVRVS